MRVERAIKILELFRIANKMLSNLNTVSRLCKGKHDRLVEDFFAGATAGYAAGLVALNKV